MPGITLVQGSSTSREVEETALRDVCFRDEYELTVHVDDEDTFLGATGYPEYPIRTVETSDAVVVLEGHLYDVADERRHLRSLSSALLDGRFEEVSQWLTDRDGDFLLVMYEKDTGTVSILNDTFARLPLYYATVGDDVFFSRELKFIRDRVRRLGEPLELDTIATAQTLLFGYQLGTRTLFDSVRRVPPGTCVQVGDGVQVQRLHTHDFEGAAHADRSVRENASALAARFEDACTNRTTDELPNVLSLSGGLDSRAVGGGFNAGGVSYTAATFEKPDGANAADVRLAERIADTLGTDWERYTVERTEAHRTDLLEMKQGMNFLGMDHILDFFEQLRDHHGAFTYVTGDGGDKALPDITPPRNFDSQHELAEYVVDAHSIFDPDEAAALTGIERETLVQSVLARLDSYPESEYDAQYVHFLVRERGINWLTHGEDRNRYYCWSTSPFYSLPFFRYAMNVPTDQKRRCRLYAAFLEELDPALCDIENANYGAPVNSLKHTAKQFAADLVNRYPRLKHAVADFFDDGANDGLADMVATQFRRADETPFVDAMVEDVIRNDDRYGGHEFYNLLTLLATTNYQTDHVARDDPKLVVSDGSGVQE